MVFMYSVHIVGAGGIKKLSSLRERNAASRYNARMNQIEAIYENGVFRPLGPVELRDKERVRLSVEPVARPDMLEWLERVRKHRQEFVAKHGFLPDSTPDIAEDRLRDI